MLALRPAGALRRRALVPVGRHLRRGVPGPHPLLLLRLGAPRGAARSSAGERESVVILGSGPNRIGQGIEFDYCCVHAAMTVRESGRDAVMINCNPETVSTDYDTSDRLYFEPLTLEDVLAVIEVEREGGRSRRDRPVRRPDAAEARRRPRERRRAAARHERRGDRPGRGPRALRRAARRPRLQGAALRDRPLGRARRSRCAGSVGFPLLVRPSYVLGGRAMEIVYSPDGLADYLRREAGEGGRRSSSTASSRTRSRSTSTRSATAARSGSAGSCSTSRRPGVHSGDSACVLPPHSLGEEMLEQIRSGDPGDRARARRRRAAERAVRGPRRRALRDRGQPARLAHGAVRLQGHRPAAREARLPDHARRARSPTLGLPQERQGMGFGDHVSVKEAVLPFDRFEGSDALLGPEMRSTGEVMGIARDFPTAFAKAQAAAGRAAARAPARCSSPSPTPTRRGAFCVAQTAARLRLSDRRHARHRAGDRAHGRPGARR